MDKKILMNEILTLLDKVNRQAQILVHLPNMARIDVDLLLAEIRQVYDKTLDLQLKIETSREEPKTEPKVIIAPPVIPKQIFEPLVQPETKTPEPLLFPEHEIPKPAPPSDFEYSKYQQKVEPLPTPPSENEYKKPQQSVTPLSIHPVQSLNTAATAQPRSLQQSYQDNNADHSIAARLQYNPINDLRSAIGINDKFLLMSQLFKGSLEQYNSAIERLNNFYKYDDAEIFLGSLKILHDWPDELSAIEKLQNFVKRRYQKE